VVAELGVAPAEPGMGEPVVPAALVSEMARDPVGLVVSVVPVILLAVVAEFADSDSVEPGAVRLPAAPVVVDPFG
jgi:hypothetical protein